METTEKLTSTNVESIFEDCLFKEGEFNWDKVTAEGVLTKAAFNHQRLESHKETISSMLCQLPKEFMKEIGGGWSFLQACMTSKGEHWGEHINIDHLVVLGIAIGRVEFTFSRELWKIFPGSMPYFVIN